MARIWRFGRQGIPPIYRTGREAAKIAFVIETLIQQLRTEIDGEVSDKSRVTDHLLDLRLAASSNLSLVSEIDRVLSEVPGRTTVANGWWLAMLDQLERACETVAVGSV